MKIAVIGRTEVLLQTAELLVEKGHEVVCVITAKAAPEYKVSEQDFSDAAKRFGADYYCGGKIELFSQQIAATGADLAVSINYSGVIPKTITDLFPHGILNAHGGDLPRYRGNACQAWAILNGEQRIGLCIHKMVGGELDSGDIITRDYMPIDHTTKITQVWDWIGLQTPHLMVEAVRKLSEDSRFVLERQSKDPESALRCYPRRPEDGRINWTQDSIDVLRLVNACNKPYAGAFCYFEGEKIVIWDAELIVDDERFCAIPGQVVKIGDRAIDVACGKGKLKVWSIQISGEFGPPVKWIRSIRKRLA